MYDASQIAEGLSKAQALDVWRTEAERLAKLGEARKGRCVGYRHLGYGSWGVFVGMQDGAPLSEAPRLRTKRRRQADSRSATGS